MNIDFQKTADGFEIAVLDGVAYAAFPREGEVLIFCKGLTPHETVGTITLSHNHDFVFDTRVKDVAAYKELIVARAEHKQQLYRLGRQDAEGGRKTPWGISDSARIYDEGVVFYSTPRHGGFKVNAACNAAIPVEYRNADGWYEEDCEAAKVVVGLPHLFTSIELRNADKTLREWFPDAYEKVNGVELAPGESLKKDERLFQEKYANDFVVISASQSDEDETMLRCYATLGGKRSGRKDGVDIVVEERRFLVPREEYRARSSFGFVIDLERHQEIAEARSPSL